MTENEKISSRIFANQLLNFLTPMFKINNFNELFSLYSAQNMDINNQNSISEINSEINPNPNLNTNPNTNSNSNPNLGTNLIPITLINNEKNHQIFINNNIFNYLINNLNSIYLIYFNYYKENNSSSINNNLNQLYLLNILQLRGIYSSLDLLWFWGIKPILNNFCLEFNENIPKSILISSELIINISKLIQLNNNKIINLNYIQIIFNICNLKIFRGMMIERFYKRILFSCILILCHYNSQSLPSIDPG